MTKMLDSEETKLFLDWLEKTYPAKDIPKTLPELCDDMLVRLKKAALNDEEIHFYEFDSKQRDALSVLLASGEADMVKDENGRATVEYASKLEIKATKIIRSLMGDKPNEP